MAVLRRGPLAWVVLLALSACRTLPSAERGVSLSAGGYLSGEVAGLREPLVLNREDYVYDAELSPDGQRLAFSRLGAKSFFLSLFSLGPPPQRTADVELNGYELDVESVAWAPDGSFVAAVSRDGALRLYDAAGAPKAAWLSDEKLVSVAVHPSSGAVAVGSEAGRVTLLSLDASGLHFLQELPLHADEVRALAFAPDGRLFTGSWDKTVRVLRAAPAEVAVNRAGVRFEHHGGDTLVRAVVQARASAPLALDERVPAALVVRARLAAAAGLDVAGSKDTVTIPTALGQQLARVVHGVSLSFKGLEVGPLDAAVCDACVPPAAEGVLGSGFVAQVSVAFDEAAHEAQLQLKGGPVAARTLLQLTEASRFEYPGCVNDLSLDRAGDKMALALSETKAQRNYDIYQREKRHQEEPVRPWDVAVTADARTGKVLERHQGHRGVVSTAGISPDGATVASGGWDHRVVLYLPGGQVDAFELGALVRKVRFSADGTKLSVAAWTPQNPLGDHQSKPAALVFPLAYRAAAAR